MTEDPLKPARGIMVGCLAGALLWGAVAFLVWRAM